MSARITNGRVALIAAAACAAALLLVATSAATHEKVITQAQSGKTFRLATGRTLTLRLGHRWSWSTPRVSSRAVQLTAVNYVLDPGFSEWIVKARAPGKATIRSHGGPGTTGTPSQREFIVTIVVG